MHLNTRISAHLMLRVGPRGSMQQCPPASPMPDRWRVAALEASAWFSFPAQRTVGVMTERENLATGPSARVTELALTTFFSRSYSRDIPSLGSPFNRSSHKMWGRRPAGRCSVSGLGSGVWDQDIAREYLSHRTRCCLSLIHISE